ncbi:MAG: hypothetical protein FGM54_01335 [Chitinophagaceae bacterium]|nr:hypothetical protein [Chitinophagaceae bacterium]
MNQGIKLGIAILCLICLADMPYGFYQFVRLLAFVGFAYLAYDEKNNNKNDTAFWIYAGLSLLFQPFLKISLGREIWNIVDVLVAGGLILSLIGFSKLKK